MNRAFRIIVAMVICCRLEIYKTFTVYEQIMEYVCELRMHAMCKIYPHVYVVGVYFHFDL